VVWLRALNQEGLEQVERVECWTHKAEWCFEEKVLWWGWVIEVVIRWWDIITKWKNLRLTGSS
jgi:hypothetical protein